MNTTLNILRTLNLSCKRYLSSGKLPHEMIIPVNNEMIACWHPEREFPYEYSLPLPEEKKVSNSVLCIGEKEITEVFRHKRKEVVIEELSKITFTTKHRWYPKNWRKRMRKIDVDRPYL
ncbi:mitochondrial ribosomal protein L42 [Calliopsis andreniformis]|uniref:mitochondrial ribosomal protein L42 n=1 Tax=Calliopsis andreniformis TaxID=337506 RepID=UPI003FCDA383